MIDETTAVIGLIVSVCTALALLWAGYKWVRPRCKRRQADRIAQRDAIIGRPAILDSITGRELAPALPGIGVRQANMEQQLTVLADAVAEMAKSNRRLDDHAAKIAANTEDIAELKAMTAERVVGKVESVQLLRTMEAVANAEPPSTPEGKS